MHEIDLADWRSFEPELEKLRDELTKRAPNKQCPELLFRGHTDSGWELTTTLERAGCERMSFADYYRRAVARSKSAIETFTGVKWDVDEYSLALEQAFRTERDLVWVRGFPSVELYRYLVYLRHHGFPSPLLDWTASPQVAAFFAFREARNGDKCSVYVYCERPNVVKGGAVGEPSMRVIGKYVRSHPRHFRQQSDYTICSGFDESGGWYFHPHPPVFGNRGADFLWKFNMPSGDRIPVLRRLDSYNLNAFSLFDTEESLLETMWFREHTSKIPG